MPRDYTPRARARSMAVTRARILETARRLLPDAVTVPVDTIAAEAGVSVQTLYTHFGSKRGLLLAVIDAAQRDAGTDASFDRVWQSPDGETALRRMVEATLRIWHRAWPVVEFAERARRADPEVLRYLREVDGYRRSNLRSITDRLALEGRLRTGLDPRRAADAAFGFSIPSVYEELVRVRGWPLARATTVTIDAVVACVIEPGTTAVADPAADWSSVLHAQDAVPSPAADRRDVRH